MVINTLNNPQSGHISRDGGEKIYHNVLRSRLKMTRRPDTTTGESLRIATQLFVSGADPQRKAGFLP
ncbi:hypothetical protein BL250_01890 [Erwinia sp. OLTSP20]|uniref:hypothetical protein n=1 Tax=unclassified Erwinia TaxID=2622719 RepID=UPI000C18C2C6|nr:MULTISPECIES: hypothetical protein [unclassified Erwinia]PIJ52077.1 hypothetical protein BV501_01435 [Erwinia sp. OAMSP11]PIJ75240.1 hypothetical protein BK416_02355 [Erwinia sp. OLSSP12]PIJ84447.1 hypothetical protein BLD47_02250 [Erwinia sp. OLCASP19]PIJ87061.1 hypothetical protein BLD46_01835 [Erwinia sp. OLMTSP26]PIJ88625.1 hypothetical protein BLD49_01420 [Erwinia sp. OLMDSP33]